MAWIPKTKRQWIAVIVLVLLLLAFLKVFTRVLDGEAVQVTVQNAGPAPIFAYIDNNGRHGSSTKVVTIKTTTNTEAPSGLLVNPKQILSFGHAVGLFDSPTLHVLPVNDAGLANESAKIDCPFRTVKWKLEIPSFHVQLKWTGDGCEVSL